MDYRELDRRWSSSRRMVVAALVFAIALALAGMTTAVAGSGSGSSGSGSGSGSGSNDGSGSGSGGSDDDGSFVLSTNYKPPTHVGVIVRGGLADCPDCVSSVEPRYVANMLGCFYDSNWVSVISLDDFRGTVTLEVLDLPSGVTSQTATTLTFAKSGVARTPFRLHASADAALGDAIVTVRATGGGLTRTMAMPISVADQLPNCP